MKDERSALNDIAHELKIANKQISEYIKIYKEGMKMFRQIDLDGEARGELSLSKEYKDKLYEIQEVIGTKTLTETMAMLIDDKVEYLSKSFK